MLARHARTESDDNQTAGASRARRLFLRRPGRLPAALLIAGMLFGPAGLLTPVARAQEVIDDDPPPPPEGGGDPGGAPVSTQSTTNQPEFNGNAGNIQAKADFGDVDPRTGAFNFSVPIEVPPGIIGLEPQVAITYSSDGPADSLLGVGFGLTADDCIERRGRGRQTQDGRWVFGRGVPEFSSSDLFYLNGRRLVRCDDQPGGATASCPAGTYRTEINDFEKVEQQPAAVPNGFKVHKKDGTTVEYGFVRYAAGRSTTFNDATHYCVSRVAKEGNEIAFAYATGFGNGFSPVSTIDYGGQSAANHRWRVRFNWVPRPADEIRESWASGGLIKMTQRLGSIDVLTLPALSRIRKYQVGYEAALSPDSNRSRVASIQEFGITDTDALPAQTFTYPPASTHGWTGTSWTIGGPADSGLNIDNAFVNTGYVLPGYPASGSKQYALGTYVADLDGDGLADLVRHDDQVHDKVWLNRGPGALTRWTLDSTWSAKFATVPHFFGGTPPDVFDQGVKLIDLNGDGYTDILQGAGGIPPCDGPHPTPNTFYAALYDPATGNYERSEATGFENFLRNNNITLSLFSRTNCGVGGDILFMDPGVLFTDVNADGLLDLVVARGGYTDSRYPERTDWIPRRQVYLNDGTTFLAPPAGTFAFPVDFVADEKNAWPHYFGVLVGDVNGDGLPDMVQQLEHYCAFSAHDPCEVKVNVWLNNGTGWTARSDWVSVINSLPMSADTAFQIHEYESLESGQIVGFPFYINYPLGAAALDLNGDGVDDLTRKYCWSTDCGYGGSWISRANAQWTNDGTWALQSQLVQHSSSLAFSQDFDGAWRFADLDRDGLADQVGNGLFSGQGQAGFVKINNMRVDRDRIAGVTNSSGGRTTITYGAASRPNNPSLPAPKIVATQITLHNGRTGGAANGEWTTDKIFVYYGGRFDASRREFAGFRVVAVRSSIDGRLSYRTTWLTNGRADACHPAAEQVVVESELFCPPGPACFIGSESSDYAPQITPTTISLFTIDSSVTNTYPACGTDTVGPFFAPVSNTTTRTFDPARPSLEVMAYSRFWYDTYGNHWATETLKQPTDTITYRDSWTQFAPPAAGGPWILDRPCASGSITPQGGANLARRAAYSYYDGSTSTCAPVTTGRLTRLDQYAWNGKALFTGLDFIGRKTFTYTTAGNIATATDERGNTTTVHWDSTLPEIVPHDIVDANLDATTFAYDAYGNLLTTTDANQTKKETRYDGLHRPNHLWMSGTNGADPAPDQTITYLSYGNPATQHSVTTTKLDATRSTISESWFDGMDRTYLDVARGGASTLAVSHAFNTSGMESKTTLPYTGTAFSLSQPLVQRDYDAIGRLFRTTLPGGTTVNTTYAIWDGGADKFVWNTQTVQTGATVERKRHELFDQYDRLRIVTECDQVNNCPVPMGSTDPAVHHTLYTYDGADNLNEIALSDGTGPAASRVYRWFDGLGRLIAFKDPDASNCSDANPSDINSGCPWRYEYDAGNNLSRATAPHTAAQSPTTVDFAYDALDRLESRSVLRGSIYAFTQFDYDNDQCGTAGAFHGRLARETYSSERAGLIFPGGGGGTDPFQTESVAYSLNSFTERKHCYDSLGRESRTETSIDLGGLGSYGPYRFDTSYNNSHAVASVLQPDADRITYGYDNLGRPQSLSTTAAGTIVSNVTYEPAGRRDTVTFGSGLGWKSEYRTTAAPVADQRLKRLSTTGAPVLDLLFDYDAAGNVRTITDQLSGIPESLGYDRLDRLQSYNVNNQPSRSYGYDSLGNRRSTTTVTTVTSNPDEIEDPNPVQWEPGGGPIVIEPIDTTITSNTYTAFGHAYAGAAGPHAPICTGMNQQDPCSGASDLFYYDVNGNLSSSYNANDGSEVQYTWDLENRLRTIDASTGASVTWFYGAMGEKVAVYENGVVTVFADPSYRIRSGQVVHDYFLGDQRIATRPQGQSTRYVLADQVGSTRALVDSATGSVVKRLDYFPFGETRTDTGAAVCTERFDGKYRDASGQDQFAARHYAPPRGVFLQPDTVTSDVYDPQALNRYAFPGNNPATLSDPTGHEGESDRPVACCIEITVTPTDWWVSFEDFDFMNPSFSVALSPAEQFRADFDKMYARDALDLRLEEPAGPEFHPPDIPSAPASGGFPISTYHGAPDLPVQDMGLGPLEYISEVKAVWSVGVRVVTGAALKVAARRAAVAAGRNAVRGGAAAVRLGQAGEAAVRAAHDIGPATRILVNGVERIPDGLNLTKGVLSEVKNVGSLSYTRQLRDYATYAARNGLRFDLYVRRSTVLSGPLQEAIESGAIHVDYIK